jgi:hypothetical protein
MACTRTVQPNFGGTAILQSTNPNNQVSQTITFHDYRPGGLLLQGALPFHIVT